MADLCRHRAPRLVKLKRRYPRRGRPVSSLNVYAMAPIARFARVCDSAPGELDFCSKQAKHEGKVLISPVARRGARCSAREEDNVVISTIQPDRPWPGLPAPRW